MLLAFDTATPLVTVALHDGAQVVAERRSDQPLKHGEQLAPLIEQVMQDAGIDRLDLAAQCGERRAAQAAHHFRVAPLALDAARAQLATDELVVLLERT